MGDVCKFSVDELIEYLKPSITDEDTLKILKENFSSSRFKQLFHCCCHQHTSAERFNNKLIRKPMQQNVADKNSISSSMRAEVIRMIGKLLCKGSMTNAILADVVKECDFFFHSYTDSLLSLISHYTNDFNSLHQAEMLAVLKNLKLNSPFKQLETIDQQIASLKESYGYIEPLEIPLGYRIDNHLDRSSETYKPKKIIETCQYVPIIETLKLVLSNKNILQVIMSEKGSTDDNILGSFIDGETFKKHLFFSRHKYVLRLQLYYDELEIVNPLGSKTGIHKLGVFYFTIQNLPSHMNSELSSIHVLVICTYEDIKKYGFKKVLEPFLEDLKKLEDDNGIPIKVEKTNFILRASIAAFCGDGLAVHDVYNFLGPSANRFCRMCMCTRQSLLANVHEAEKRSRIVYDNHLRKLEEKNFSQEVMTETGIKGFCCLNDSKYFHITDNKVFDPMHDLLCGICPMIMKLVLKQYIINQKLLDASEFNARLQSFQYGFIEKGNQPSANFTASMLRQTGNTLSQKAMQTWCLIRIFPFILHDKISDEDNYMELILLLLRIMELVFAPKIFKSQLPYLRTLISDFTEAFKLLFPSNNLINKMHHLHHYCESILASGPTSQYNCMRNEAKHNELKIRAQNICNYKNPPKTLIRAPQCSQSARWGSNDVGIVRFHIINDHKMSINNTQSKTHLLNLGFKNSDTISTATAIKYNGVEFRLNLYVCLEADHKRADNLPLFGVIKEIVIINKNLIYLLTSPYKSALFDVSLNAFKVQPADNLSSYRFVQIQKLPHFKPFCTWNVPNSDSFYISLRHIII